MQVPQGSLERTILVRDPRCLFSSCAWLYDLDRVRMRGFLRALTCYQYLLYQLPCTIERCRSSSLSCHRLTHLASSCSAKKALA